MRENQPNVNDYKSTIQGSFAGNSRIDDFDNLQNSCRDQAGSHQRDWINWGGNRTAIFGNVYRSPSRNDEKCNMLLENVLQKLHWYTKKKLLYLVGDFNQDILKYNTDTNSQNLIDMCSSHGLVQLVSRPTRITDSSATLIDHVYTNNVDNIKSCNILTVDLTDHLATHTKISF